MRRIIPYFLVASCGIAFGVAIGFFLATEISWKGPVIAEFKIHHHNLQKDNLQPQLHEYLKSRIYSLANLLEPRDLHGFRFDFGPVNVDVLRGTTGIKGPETESETYESAIKKHAQKGH